MRAQAFDFTDPRHPTLRADRPTVVEVAPEVADTLVVASGSVFMALAGVCFALYLMLPFGA